MADQKQIFDTQKNKLKPLNSAQMLKIKGGNGTPPPPPPPPTEDDTIGVEDIVNF